MTTIIFPVSQPIREKLAQSSVPFGKEVRVVESSYRHFSATVKRDYAYLKDEAEHHALAVLCCLTHPEHKHKHFELNHPIEARKQKLQAFLEREDVAVFGRWIFGLVVLLLLSVIAARAQGTSQIDVIQFQDNTGAVVGVVASPYKFKAGANCSLSKSGSTVTFNCSAAAGGAGGIDTQVQRNNTGSLGGITNATSDGTNFTKLTGTGAFDWTGGSSFKVRTAAGLTVAANGELGYDTTAPRWHIWFNGSDRKLIVSTNDGAVGQAFLSNADGTGSFADPIVSGPALAGVAPGGAPVYVAGDDYTTGCATGTKPCIRTFKVDSSGFLHVFVESAPTTAVTGSFWQATQPVSGTFWQATQPVSIATMPSTPVTGTFWQATQPVSGTITANAGSGTFNNQQSNITTDYDTGVGTQTMTMFGLGFPASGGAVAAPGDVTNGLFVNVKSAVAQAIATWAGGTLGAMANYGTSPGAVLVPGMNAFVTNIPHVICDSGCTPGGSTADNSAFTFGTTALNPMGAVVDDVATNTVAENSIGTPRMNGSRILYFDLSKTAANTNKLLVTPDLPTGAALDSSLSTIDTDIKAAQPRKMQDGAGNGLTSNSSTYTAKFGLDGNLLGTLGTAFSTAGKVDTKAADGDFFVRSNAAATFPVNLGTWIGSAAPTVGSKTSANSIPAVIASDQADIPVKMGQPTRSTGTLTSTTCAGTGCVSVATAGYSVATVTINGTYSLTPVFEFSDDGSTFYSTTCTRTDSAVQENGGGALVNTARAWDCSVYAASNFRVRASSFTSGTANIGITLSAASIEAAPTVALSAGTNVIGHVIADTGSTTAVTGNVASTVADGANVVLGAKADAKSTATDTTAITMMQVLKQISASVQAPPSQAVTNTGTFAVQAAATLAAETTKVIGTVRATGNIGAVFDGPTGSAVPANAILMGGTDGTNTVAPYIDPCQRGAKTKTLINLASTTSTKLVALASAKVIYVCSLNIVVAGANNVALITGTKVTTECDTSTAGVAGGTTAAAGWNFAANGGLTLGNGSSWVLSGGTALDLCILASANTQVSGSITTVTF